MRFTNKVALITAAASGIGRATAEIMVREGCHRDRRRQQPGPARRGVASLKRGGRAEGRLVDALVPARSMRWSPTWCASTAPIDILVNAVGGSTVIANPQATTEQLAFADWQKLIAFNLDGTFLVTHAVIPVMKRQRSARSSTSPRSPAAASASTARAPMRPPRAASSPSPASSRTSSAPTASTSTRSRPASP
jgi:NAD(P)-dependent dehydrogenase (short-subunit alcohol dehydrogenase family)